MSEKRFSVKLVALTQPSIQIPENDEIRALTPDEFVAYTARVSNPTNQANTLTMPKLVKYLKDHAHWSPFEMCSAVLEVETSRAIAAQILRHRSFSFQEFSQRYQESTSAGYVEYDIRRQDLKNRQNSIDDLPKEWEEEFRQDQKEIWDLASSKYQKWIDRSGAKECARFLLPLNTKTKLYIAGTLRSWIHYVAVRTEDGVQLEHKEIAVACRDLLAKELPSIFEVPAGDSDND